MLQTKQKRATQKTNLQWSAQEETSYLLLTLRQEAFENAMKNKVGKTIFQPKLIPIEGGLYFDWSNQSHLVNFNKAIEGAFSNIVSANWSDRPATQLKFYFYSSLAKQIKSQLKISNGMKDLIRTGTQMSVEDFLLELSQC